MNKSTLVDALHKLNSFHDDALLDLMIGQGRVGYIHPDYAETFLLTGLFEQDGQALRFSDTLKTCTQRTDALKQVADQLIANGKWKPSKFKTEWRPTGGPDHLNDPQVLVWREYCRKFGIHTDTTYMLLQRENDGQIWLQIRPGGVYNNNTIDTSVGGAHMAGGTLRDTLIAEATEEANIDPSWIPQDIFVNRNPDQNDFAYLGSVTFKNRGSSDSVADETHHSFLLRVPADFIPDCRNPEEVSSFIRVSPEEVLRLTGTPLYTSNSKAAIAQSLVALEVLKPGMAEYDGVKNFLSRQSVTFAEQKKSPPPPKLSFGS